MMISIFIQKLRNNLLYEGKKEGKEIAMNSELKKKRKRKKNVTS